MRTEARLEGCPALLVLDELTGAPATLVLDERNATLYLVEGASRGRLRLHSETPIHLSLGGQLTVGPFQFTWVTETPWLDDEGALMDFTEALVNSKHGRHLGRIDWPWRARLRSFRRAHRLHRFAIDGRGLDRQTPVESTA